MFPKLATNLLHTNLSRVAFTQTQAAQFRTVLQFQPSYPPSPLPPTPLQPNSLLASQYSPSNSKSDYSHPGGSKSNPGSKFYAGYTGPGRAVTQANAITSYDNSVFSEDIDGVEITVLRHSKDTISLLPPSRRGRERERRNSMALGFIGPSRVERAAMFGVLYAVQAHTRHHHVFARPPMRPSPLSQDHSTPPPTIDTPRDDSTLAHSSPDHTLRDLPPSLLPSTSDINLGSIPNSPAQSVSSLDSPASVPSSPQVSLTPASTEWRNRLNAAKSGRGTQTVDEVVAELRSSTDGDLVLRGNYEVAIEALFGQSQRGAPISNILELYNDMVTKGVIPQVRTFSTVIKALCRRDRDIKHIIFARGKTSNHVSGNLGTWQLQGDVRQSLEDENNLASALALFHAATIGQNAQFDLATCTELLNACALSKNVDAAIRVFAHAERHPYFNTYAGVYSGLMRVYNSVKDLAGAKEVFEEFKKQRITAENSTGVTAPWNCMIEAYFIAGQSEKAIGLVEKMLDSGVGSSLQPTSTTYAAVIQGFITSGDTASGLTWFNQLVAQSARSTKTAPPRPSFTTFEIILDALEADNNIEEYLRIASLMQQARFSLPDKLLFHRQHLVNMVRKNLQHAALDDPKVDRYLSVLKAAFIDFSPSVSQVWEPNLNIHMPRHAHYGALEDAVGVMLNLGRFDMAAELVELVKAYPVKSSFRYDPVNDSRLAYQSMMENLVTVLRTNKPLHEKISLRELMSLSSLQDVDGSYMGQSVLLKAADLFVDAYRQASGQVASPLSQLSDSQLPLLVSIFTQQLRTDPEFTSEYIAFMSYFNSVMETTSSAPAILSAIDSDSIVSALIAADVKEAAGVDTLRLLGNEALQSYRSFLAEQAPPVLPTPPEVKIDIGLTRAIDEWTRRNANVTALDSYAKFEEAARKGFYPTADSVARLINGVARGGGTFDQVKTLYGAAQLILSTLESDRQWQAQGWFQVENSMVIACSLFNDVISANLHRTRVIDQGGAPSADGYAALIVASKETTDDATIASSLFAESQNLGVLPNAYLYNTVISKLSRARRADDALAMFAQMKQSGVFPTSVTYGALIGACARVGDEASSLYLFEEMHTQKNYRPRIPPFNTMMQLYVNVKPDREKALSFYKRMLASGVRPTAHTYKLLLDCYGAIEPVDASAMESIFETMVMDRSVVVNGTHWASLINSWGCVTKDLERAVAIFDSIATHPATLKSSAVLPDAVCYEALINVLVSHHRMDLVAKYVQQLKDSNVHMTAYVANVLIRGYAASGDLDGARRVFENLVDAPSGYAAVNNHAAHETDMPNFVPPEAPVYREPSSWEAMVRAELGAGERERAQALLERMETRHYPEGVVNRIRGILGGEPSGLQTPSSLSDADSIHS